MNTGLARYVYKRLHYAYKFYHVGLGIFLAYTRHDSTKVTDSSTSAGSGKAI